MGNLEEVCIFIVIFLILCFHCLLIVLMMQSMQHTSMENITSIHLWFIKNIQFLIFIPEIYKSSSDDQTNIHMGCVVLLLNSFSQDAE